MIRNITLILIGLVTIFAIACSKEESPQPAAPEQAAPAQSQAAATQAAPVQPVAQAPTPTPAPTPVPAPASASETFSSSKGLFRLTHSSGWASREFADGTGVLLASSPGALARFEGGSPTRAGDFVVNVTLTPVELYQAAFLPVESGVGAAGIAEGLLKAYQSINET